MSKNRPTNSIIKVIIVIFAVTYAAFIFTPSDMPSAVQAISSTPAIAATRSTVKYEVANRKESNQAGEKTIDERLILTSPVDKETLRGFLLSRYEGLRNSGFQKVFIYAYPSKDAFKSPLLWAARLERLGANGGDPRVYFNDEQLGQIKTVSVPSAPAPVQDSGNWVVQEDRSPMDDSKTVFLSVTADAPIQAWLKTPTPVLWIRCHENKTSVIVETSAAPNPELGAFHEATVRIRLDKGQAFTQTWTEATNGEALFAPNPISLAKQIAKADAMIFEFTPFNSSSVAATFSVRGLAVKLPLVAETCGWKM